MTKKPAPIKPLRVVLTGGPCGGKTVALKHVSTQLKEKGINTFTIPEVPSILLQGGCQYPGLSAGESLIKFETHVINLQIAMEDAFVGMANTLIAQDGKPSVVLMDRGVLDVKAYLPPTLWGEILQRTGFNEPSLLLRYDTVVHMITAADGAERHYSSLTNEVRRETAGEACTLDRKIRECWVPHPSLHVIDNSTDFPNKLRRTEGIIYQIIQNLVTFFFPAAAASSSSSSSSTAETHPDNIFLHREHRLNQLRNADKL